MMFHFIICFNSKYPTCGLLIAFVAVSRLLVFVSLCWNGTNCAKWSLNHNIIEPQTSQVLQRSIFECGRTESYGLIWQTHLAGSLDRPRRWWISCRVLSLADALLSLNWKSANGVELFFCAHCAHCPLDVETAEINFYIWNLVFVFRSSCNFPCFLLFLLIILSWFFAILLVFLFCGRT